MLIVQIYILWYNLNAFLQAMNGFEALRGAYRNHLNSEEERMVNLLIKLHLHIFFIFVLEFHSNPFKLTERSQRNKYRVVGLVTHYLECTYTKSNVFR